MKLTGILAEKGLHALDGETRFHAGHEVPRIWVIAADRARAHVFMKTPRGLENILSASTNDSRAAGAENGKDFFHGYDMPPEKGHPGDGAFIRGLADWLEAASQEGVFDRLVLVAAPRTLSDIRAALSRNVHARVVAEVSRELAGMPASVIRKHLADIVWF